ncbi:hypothetical protein P4S72_29950 [Vibrio sp. PP-XX7]
MAFLSSAAPYPERFYSPSMAHQNLKNPSGIFIRSLVDFSAFYGGNIAGRAWVSLPLIASGSMRFLLLTIFTRPKNSQ